MQTALFQAANGCAFVLGSIAGLLAICMGVRMKNTCLKFLSFMVIMVMVFPIVTSSAQENQSDIANSLSNTDSQIVYLEGTGYKIGDVNLDGYISKGDVTYLQEYLAGIVTLNEMQLSLADFNQDGNVNMNDVTAIQSFMNRPLIRINGTQYRKGATLKLTVEYKCTAAPVAALKGTITYDADAIVLDRSSIAFYRIGNPVYNTGLSGAIKFNSVSLNTFNLSTMAPILTINFVVPEDTEITSTIINFFMEELIDFDLNPLKGKQRVTITELGF